MCFGHEDPPGPPAIEVAAFVKDFDTNVETEPGDEELALFLTFNHIKHGTRIVTAQTLVGWSTGKEAFVDEMFRESPVTNLDWWTNSQTDFPPGGLNGREIHFDANELRWLHNLSIAKLTASQAIQAAAFHEGVGEAIEIFYVATAYHEEQMSLEAIAQYREAFRLAYIAGQVPQQSSPSGSLFAEGVVYVSELNNQQAKWLFPNFRHLNWHETERSDGFHKCYRSA